MQWFYCMFVKFYLKYSQHTVLKNNISIFNSLLVTIMESKKILFLLVTLNVILARPETDYGDYDYTAQEEECEDFFINGKAVERYNLQTQAEYFNYT